MLSKALLDEKYHHDYLHFDGAKLRLTWPKEDQGKALTFDLKLDNIAREFAQRQNEADEEEKSNAEEDPPPLPDLTFSRSASEYGPSILEVYVCIPPK